MSRSEVPEAVELLLQGDIAPALLALSLLHAVFLRMNVLNPQVFDALAEALGAAS